MKMRSLVFLLGVALTLSSCSKSDNKEDSKQADSKMPVFTLSDSSTYEFGTIQEGVVVEHDFKFRNDGEYPLILNNITSSCGCTTPEWPKDPIGPKQTASIKVRFDSKNKTGPQVKTITVYANTEPAYTELRLRGIVNAAPKPDTLN
ncbi:DUF1573 domain-containing protein [Dyadobacter sp. CY399]|uniref:DUF1573 domain-containing protein n=2 Tax=Dyadobacter fanqingshengii TaxID=2906443 RepID=A0A9X1P5W7_9BACT|nr:DUF1573 domain-containing protein [Dyadobacter fanqingshengii]MCF0039414.1 DUF1573 domain-containing protein [Dyadobacter fanqingshengii]USJ33773.1 DUF1573 domain-containing protein [Dyadobacter fanqingshengii]